MTSTLYHRPSSLVFLALAALTGTLACSTIQTRTDFDPEVDFTALTTWGWVSEENLIVPQLGAGPPSYVSSLDEQRIRRAVAHEMAAKGWQQRTTGDADLVVGFTIGVEEKTGVRSTPSTPRPYYADGYYYDDWYERSEVRTYHYTEGTLSLQFFARETKKAVWVGWGSKRLSTSEDPDDVIRAAVEKILADFPSHTSENP